MALPTLNSSRYPATIPSTGQKVEFRPFLVKEEKILMVAMESKDTGMMISALKDIIQACVFDELDVDQLTSFDLEELFLRLRSKSVGEKVSIQLKCSECGGMTPTEVNLDDVTTSEVSEQKHIMLTDSVGVEFAYPSVELVSQLDFDPDETTGEEQLAITEALIKSCMVNVFDNDNVWDVSNQTEEELNDFIDGLNSAQFAKITEFFGSIPTLTHTVKFKCISCGHQNELEIKGLESFFI